MQIPIHLRKSFVALLSFGLLWPAVQLQASTEPVPLPAPGTGTLMGAGAVLNQINSDKSVGPRAVASDPVADLKQRVKDFGEKSAALPPEQAARTWVDLADRFVALAVKPPKGLSESQPSGFAEIVAVLPPPAAWPALERIVAARQPHKTKSQRDLTLLLLAHVLNEKKTEQWKDLAALRPQLERGGLSSQAKQLALAMAKVSGDKKRLLQIAGQTNGHERYAQAANSSSTSPGVLPDLVSLLGRAQAEARLRTALLNGTAEISIPLGDETRQLAQQLALSLASRLRVPQWQLAHSLDSMQLFKAMESRFVLPPSGKGTKVPKSYGASYRHARTYYLMGLIANGRTQDAITLGTRLARNKQFTEIPVQALESLDQSGHSLALNYFLREMLTRHPDLPLWSIYIANASRAGQTSTTLMLDLVRKHTTRKGMNQKQALVLRQYLYQALLAADRVDEGASVLRQLLAAPVTAQGAGVRSEYAVALVRLGRVVNRPEWIDEGLRALGKNYVAPEEAYEGYVGSTRIHLLIQVGRDGDAEKDLISAMKKFAAKTNNPSDSSESFDMYGKSLGAQAELTELAGIYHRRGRHKDVLDLLENARWWGVKDLSDVLSVSDVAGTPLGYMAATAMAVTGRTEDALAVITALLRQVGGYDPAYALLVELQGEKSLPLLDELFTYDQFEERPLIWKAAVLLKSKQFEEAERIARQAIRIDPSDGEQGKGDRMRVYSVLADIREARGDAAQAKTFRGAVEAIRVSESADDLYAAGLLSRGIKMYKQALTHFSDAYCIQSRLSIQLAAAGRLQEAEEHYRRAYELMPDSFGRMESHCFGCEGAFQGDQAATIAESVFKRLLAKTPEKPQLHYLMGYLRQEQDRPSEALTHFRRATQLDRDYINAWKSILETGERLQLPQADREAATLNLLRLDPGFRHGALNSSNVTNLKQMWEALVVAREVWKRRQPGALMTLTASAPVAEKLKDAHDKQLAEYGISPDDMMDTSGEPMVGRVEPGRIIAQQVVLASLSQLMDARLYLGYRNAQ